MVWNGKAGKVRQVIGGMSWGGIAGMESQSIDVSGTAGKASLGVSRGGKVWHGRYGLV